MSDLVQVSRSNLRQGAVYMMVGLIWGVGFIPADVNEHVAEVSPRNGRRPGQDPWVSVS